MPIDENEELQELNKEIQAGEVEFLRMPAIGCTGSADWVVTYSGPDEEIPKSLKDLYVKLGPKAGEFMFGFIEGAISKEKLKLLKRLKRTRSDKIIGAINREIKEIEKTHKKYEIINE